MAENSAISWTDHTFNPWIGCARISPACDGCYAAGQMGMEGGRFPKRADWGGPGKGEGTRTRTAPSTWAKPRKWDREAAAEVAAWRANPFADPSTPKPTTFVFCASLADVFDNAVPPQWRRDLFDLIRETPHLTWLLLTKRPGNIVKMYDQAMVGSEWCGGPFPRNAALGCTVVNQEEADRDIPKLLAAKAALGPAFAFLSMEPLLGPVLLGKDTPAEKHDYLTGGWWEADADGQAKGVGPALDWVITGGETDQKTEEGMHLARPADPAWFRSLRDQCEAAGVAYHHKQNGEWVSESEVGFGGGQLTVFPSMADPERRTVRRVGKANDPCTLDGVLHRARPEVRA